MKPRKLIASAASMLMMLGVMSCSQDLPVPAGGDGNVTFTATLANVPQTRAFATGEQAINLTCLIYDQNGKFLLQKEAVFSNLKAEVQLNLIKDEVYDLVFFAKPSTSVYSIDADTHSLTIDYSRIVEESDGEYLDNDCFYKVRAEYTAGSNSGEDIILTRPISQINFGTDDLEVDLTKKNFPEGVNSEITLSVYSQMDLLTGKPIGSTTKVTYPMMKDRLLSNDCYPVNATITDQEGNEADKYKYVYMAYALVDVEGQLEEITYKASNAGAGVVEFSIPNVPLKRNYRTNIYGSLLSPNTLWNVEINPDWDGSYDVTDYEDAIAKGGTVNVTIPLDKLTIPKDLDAPVVLNIEQPVKKLEIGETTQPVTINVLKGVPYPEMVFESKAAIKDLTIKGDPKSDEVLSGFDFYYYQSNKLPRLSEPASFENLTIDGCTFEGRGFEPEYTCSAKNTVLRNCKFKNMTRAAVMTHVLDGGTDHLSIEGMTIENCEIDFAEEGVVANANGLYIQDVTGDIVVKNTIVRNSAYHGIQITPRRGEYTVNVLVEGNAIEGNAEDGIKIQEVYAGTITVKNNKFKGNKKNGIRVKNAIKTSDVTITGNEIDMAGADTFVNGEPYAILLVNTVENAGAKVVVKDNTIINSNGYDYQGINVKYAEGSEYPGQTDPSNKGRK